MFMRTLVIVNIVDMVDMVDNDEADDKDDLLTGYVCYLNIKMLTLYS